MVHAHPAAALDPAKIEPSGETELAVAAAMTNCRVREVTTGRLMDFGHSFAWSRWIWMGTQYSCFNVQLSGWDLDFLHSDHHIDHIKVRARKSGQSGGWVRVTVDGYYRDKNGDDDFYYQVWVTVLGIG